MSQRRLYFWGNLKWKRLRRRKPAKWDKCNTPRGFPGLNNVWSLENISRQVILVALRWTVDCSYSSLHQYLAVVSALYFKRLLFYSQGRAISFIRHHMGLTSVAECNGFILLSSDNWPFFSFFRSKLSLFWLADTAILLQFQGKGRWHSMSF